MKIQYTPIQLQNPQYVHTCAVSAEGGLLVLGQGRSSDSIANLTLWDISSLKFIREMNKQSEHTILKARFIRQYLIYLDDSHKVYLHNIETQAEEILNFADLNLDWLSSSNKTNRFVAAGALTYAWDIETKKIVWTSPEEAVAVIYKDLSAIGDLHPDGTQIAIAGLEENQVVIYSIKDNTVVKKLKKGPKQAARWIAYDPTGSYLATINYGNGAVLLWDKDDELYSFEDEEDFEGIWSLSFHPSGNYLACGSLSGNIQILDLKTNKTVFNKRVHNKRVWDITFTPDGKNMISAGEGGAYFWELDGL